MTVAAIITMTSPETASAVADVLRHTNVQHVDVTSDPLEDNVIIRDNHYTISNTPRARVEVGFLANMIGLRTMKSRIYVYQNVHDFSNKNSQ